MDVNLVVLGGKTGSGKSEVLRVLAESGCQMLDLEAIAHHKGSAFGHIGQEEQPTTEQFENNLYEVWKSFDLKKPVWLEDESRSIGRVSIPEPLFNRMRNSPVIFIDLSIEERAKRLVKEYAEFEPESLESAVLRISKRLGGQNVKDAIQAIKMKEFSKAASITLLYYDKAYLNGLEKRSNENVFKLPLEEDNPERNAILVKDFYAASITNVEKK
jgi:tRNA 2-selenouridine synthase